MGIPSLETPKRNCWQVFLWEGSSDKIKYYNLKQFLASAQDSLHLVDLSQGESFGCELNQSLLYHKRSSSRKV